MAARILLRPFTQEEAEHVLASNRAGRRWSPGYPREDDRDVARMFLAAPGGDPLFGPHQIVLLSTGEVIGAIGFFGPPDSGDETVRLGYGVAPEVEGHGYATEAVEMLVEMARGSGVVTRVLADTAHDNLGSQRVLEKAGFTQVVLEEQAHFYEIRWRS